ncbi:MAG: DUF2231 domain-containing protein [Sphingomonas sp.]|nr:DUF2231 domain-containing protein [Sphingomonas sp.]
MPMHDIHADQPTHANPRSTAAIGGHPIHPMLVPFPIVCFAGTLLADIMLVSTGGPGWATASYWLLAVGLGVAALAAVAGFADFFGDPLVRGHSDAVKHMAANLTLVVLEAMNLLLRRDNPGFIASTGVYLSAVAVLIMLHSGWKGGELVFRHGVGVLTAHRRE